MHEFFAGSGLVAAGLKDYFQIVWANDFSENKARFYRANLNGSVLEVKDIRDVDGSELPAANLSWASFPCQDLSLAGSMEGIGASRSGLVWEWLRILDEQHEKPKVLALENVIGLISSKGGINYRTLHSALIERGYKAGAFVLNASRFVPQSRPRVFVVAVPKETVVPKTIIADGPSWVHNSATCRLAESLEDWVWWSLPVPCRRSVRLEDIIEKDEPFDMDSNIALIPARHRKMLESAPDGIYPGYRRTRGGKQCLELRFDGLAGCLRTPNGGSSKQLIVEKSNGELHARFMTVKEYARLMGAPETYILPGSKHDGYMAMGDAVALPVAKYIAEHLLLPLTEVIYK